MMNAEIKILNEADVRQLRDRVFEQTSTDNNWNACRVKWLEAEAVAWLLSKAGNLEP